MPNEQQMESKTGGTNIEPATGKLGIMVVGLGAVATTMIAGVEAVRRGLAKPIGSLTQMGTIRLGKRTDSNTPLIKNFVPLAGLNDIVFTGWDIFEDNVYESAAHAKVLEKETLDQLKQEKVLDPWQKWNSNAVTTDVFLETLYNDVTGKKDEKLIKHN